MNTFTLALADARAGRPLQALAGLEKAISENPANSAALGHKAWILRSLGRYEDAEQCYLEYLKLRPEDDHAGAMLADLHRLLGHQEKALTECIALLTANPRNADATRVLAAVQRDLGIAAVPPAGNPTERETVPMRAVNPAIMALEGVPESFPGSVYPEVGRLLYTMVRCVRPKLVVETGCFIGYSTMCIAQGLQDNGGGRLHSFDVFRPRHGYVSPICGSCEDPLIAARAHLEFAGLSDHVTLHKGLSYVELPAVLNSRSGEQIDLAFIDGDHTLQGCLRDWNAVTPFLSPGALVMLHDTEPESSRWLGPRFLIDNIPQNEARSYQALTIPSPEGAGIGLIQKKDPDAPALTWQPTIKELLLEAVLLKRHWGWFRTPKNF